MRPQLEHSLCTLLRNRSHVGRFSCCGHDAAVTQFILHPDRLYQRCGASVSGADAIDEDETGAAAIFPEGSADPRGADICLHTASFRSQRSTPSQPQGLVFSSAIIQEFLVWVVAFSTLLGIFIVLVTRQRKKAQQRAFADSIFTGRDGGGNFDSDIIREYKARYYAREKGLEAAMRRSNEEGKDRDD